MNLDPDPEICSLLIRIRETQKHSQFRKKCEKYFFTICSLKSIFKQLCKNNGTSREFWLKMVNICQSVQPFSLLLIVRIRIRNWYWSGSTKLLNTDPIWIRNHNTGHYYLESVVNPEPVRSGLSAVYFNPDLQATVVFFLKKRTSSSYFYIKSIR